MNFIDNPQAALRHYSTIALGLASSVLASWIAIPDAIKTGFPPQVAVWIQWVTFGVVVFGLFGKFIDQTPRPGFPLIDPPQPKDTP